MCLSPSMPKMPTPPPPPATPPPPTPVAKNVKNRTRARRSMQRSVGNPLVISRESSGVNTGSMQSGAGLY